MRRLLFCANWKMHIGPDEARAFARRFRSQFHPSDNRETWFFPSAVSIEAAASSLGDLPNTRIGIQDVHWEAKGAFTGAVSIPLAKSAGASACLIGHSERRHVFGETDAETARKVQATLGARMIPVLCVGEKLEQRERGETGEVVQRQLSAAVKDVPAGGLDRLVVAYEPVWAIGTGRNATPSDAAAVHAEIRASLKRRGATSIRILYGGSVNQANVTQLLAEPELDGVLVGGASLDPDGWAAICSV